MAIDATASGGFNSPINLSCTGLPVGCDLRIQSARNYARRHGRKFAIDDRGGNHLRPADRLYDRRDRSWEWACSVWCLAVDRKHQRGIARRTRLWALGSAVLLLGLLLGAVGCSNSSNHSAAPPGTSVMVVGTVGRDFARSPAEALTIQ